MIGDQLIGIDGWMLANSPREQGSILFGVIPKTQKVVFDAYLFNTHHY